MVDVILQHRRLAGIFAVIGLMGAVAIAFVGQAVPDWLTTILFIATGWFFGAETQRADMSPPTLHDHESS